MINKYLKAFKEANELKDCFQLIGDRILAYPMELKEMGEQKTKGGLYLPESNKNQRNSKGSNLPTMAVVLQVGVGYYDEVTGEDVPLDTKPGDIIVVGQNDLPVFSQFGKVDTYMNSNLRLGITTESCIQMRWRGQKQYEEYFKILEENLK